MFIRQKRQVPKPDLVGPHQSVNPMFVNDRDWSGYRTQVVLWTFGILLGIFIGYVIFGPWFSIVNITVSGTRQLDSQSIKQTTEKYLDSRRWIVFPNRSLLIVSTHGLSQHLEKQIRQRISVEGITVEKKKPHTILIVIAERTPIANWSSGVTIGTIDKQGKIIELLTTPDKELPLIHDENEKLFSVDGSVVKPDVITGVQLIKGYMAQANIQVKEYLIPEPVCPIPLILEEAPKDSILNSNTTTNIPTTSNSSVLLSNSPVKAPVSLPCDREALRYSSQEIHVQLVDGPRILFDRHSDLAGAVLALKRVLTEQKNTTYTSIDVRFGDRAYVQ